MTKTEKIIAKRAKNHHPIRDWWQKNNYKAIRVILFPVWLVVLWKEKTYKRKYAEAQYDEATAKAFLDVYIPRKAEIENSDLWYCLDWHWHFSKKQTPRKYRIFVSKFYIRILDYLVNGYELEGYTKTKEWEDYMDYDRWLKFSKKG